MSKVIIIFVSKLYIMGWGTFFTPEIYINKKHYHTIHDVLGDINNIESDILSTKNELLILSSMSPQLGEKSLDDFVFEIRVKVESLFEKLEDLYFELNTLTLLKEHFENNKEVINE